MPLIFTLFFWTLLPAVSHAADQVGALKAASRGAYAQAIQKAGSDLLVRDLVIWVTLKEGESGPSFDAIQDMMKRHPAWPAQARARFSAETQMTSGLTPDALISFFKDDAPMTPHGLSRYVAALREQKQNEKAQDAIRAFWEHESMSRQDQKTFFSAYENDLTKQNHRQRLRGLIYRNEYTNARAVAAVLGGAYQALAEARIALREGKPDVNARLAKVPSSLLNDEGLLFDRLQWRRKNNLDDGMIQILAKAPAASAMYSPRVWWKERHILVRRLIEKKQFKRAYDIASAHKQKEGFPLAEAEFVAGWLALRFVNKPWQAFEHFEKLYHHVETPISRARGAYWAGRASEALKHGEVAQKWYRAAAQYPTTFYGQLARANAGQGEGIPASVNTRGGQLDETGRAAQLLARAGLMNEASVFFVAAAENAKTAGDFTVLADEAARRGLPDIAIKISGEALQKGFFLKEAAYPIVTDKMRKITDVEWAMAHALIRQESRFDPQAVSPAGARGYMQLMPATARETARKLGVSHKQDWLTTRPDHNIQLGTRYIAQMVDRFNGNYAMAFAAYNAGPSRVDGWVRQFGDPRSGNVDVIDWIEMIPIYETRNYVQRVLEGVYVYRQLLKGKQPAPVIPIHVAYDQGR